MVPGQNDAVYHITGFFSLIVSTAVHKCLGVTSLYRRKRKRRRRRRWQGGSHEARSRTRKYVGRRSTNSLNATTL